MFIVYAVPIGLLVGGLFGGRLERLGDLRFRLAWLALAGLLVQVVLFSSGVGDALGQLAPAVYVGSTLAVLAAVLANVRLPGLPLIAAGATLNLAAIVANGGYMPGDPGAYALAGLTPDDGFSNSVVRADAALRPLTDIFALPDAMPLANVFSVGDVLIGFGVAVAIALAMRPGGAVQPHGAPLHSPD